MYPAMRAAGASLLLALGAAAFQDGLPTGPQLVRTGRLEEALRAFRAELEDSPKSVAANNGVGVVLDLMGRYSDAQRYFTQAIRAARTPLDHALAERAMAISHGFAGDCKGAEKYETSAFEFYHDSGDFYNAGEVANELARLCLEAGDLNRAAEWYYKGYDTGVDEPNITQARKDLWRFRLLHAQARLAARRGKFEEARKRVKEARTVLDKGTNPGQEEYFPYLVGYVAFYAADYSEALAALQNATATDPFIQCLIARTYESMGNREKALEYYRKAASSTAHSVPAAFARPFATRKLQ